MTAQLNLFPLAGPKASPPLSPAAPPPAQPRAAARTYWSDADIEQALDRGVIVALGQLSPRSRRQLDRRVAKGELVKWRGHWTTLSPDYGFGPLKTIFARRLPQPCGPGTK